MLLSVRILNPLFPEVRKLTGVPLGLLFLAFWPVVEALPHGQDSMFVFLFLAMGFRLYCDRKDFASGAAVSLALFKFQYVIPTVGILFLRRRGRLVLGAILVGIVTLLASWALVGTSGMLGYWQMLRYHPMETEWEMVNLRGLVDSLRGTYSPAITLIASALVAVWAFLGKPRDRAEEFAAALLVSVLVSFHMHMYDMVVLLIPVMVVLERAARNRDWADAIVPLIFFCAVSEPLSARLRIEYLWALPSMGLLAAVTLRKRTDRQTTDVKTALPTSA
jgi:hypothetical protein